MLHLLKNWTFPKTRPCWSLHVNDLRWGASNTICRCRSAIPLCFQILRELRLFSSHTAFVPPFPPPLPLKSLVPRILREQMPSFSHIAFISSSSDSWLLHSIRISREPTPFFSYSVLHPFISYPWPLYSYFVTVNAAPIAYFFLFMSFRLL